MSYQGFDTSQRITVGQAKNAAAQELTFVCRYLGPESWGKTITRAEAKGLLDAGLSILLCYETVAARMRTGAPGGAEDGALALQCATELGVPEGTVIYFACDFDVQQSELPTCEEYINAARIALGRRYEVGIYGPERIVAHMSEKGICRYFWQCVAWSRTFLPEASARQYAWQGDSRSIAMAAKIGVLAVDLDDCDDLVGAGMWQHNEPWYAKAMRYVKAKGLMNDGRPNDPVTRAELAMVIYRHDGGK